MSIDWGRAQPVPTAPPRRRWLNGFTLRLLMAAGIALFAYISFLSNVQENPITGEKQRVAMDPEQEVAMGLQAAPEMAQQFGGLERDPRAQALVDKIGAKLLAALDQVLASKGRQDPYKFDFHLLADPKTVNAFALPGGQVFITNALFRRLETEGQLAGVLGHEVGHVLERHSSQRLAKEKLTQGLVGAAGVAGGSMDTARMAMMVGQMINMKYGREDELQSDKWGVLLTAQAGYDPRAMLGVMKILDEATGGGGGPPEMMSTHPKPANRAAYIEQVLKDVFPDGVPPGLAP